MASAIQHESDRFCSMSDAYDDLAEKILHHHNIRPDRRRGVRPWTQLNNVYKSDRWLLDGGYFIQKHPDPRRGHWIEAIPQIGSRAHRQPSVCTVSDSDSDDSDDDATVTHARRIVVHSSSARTSDNESVSDIVSLFSDLSLKHDKLTTLQIILRALDERHIPDTITQCRTRLHQIHVNIWDLAPAVRAEMAIASGGDDSDDGRSIDRACVWKGSGRRVPRYTFVALAEELLNNKKRRFPKQKAKDEMLRDLLRLIGC